VFGYHYHASSIASLHGVCCYAGLSQNLRLLNLRISIENQQMSMSVLLAICNIEKKYIHRKSTHVISVFQKKTEQFETYMCRSFKVWGSFVKAVGPDVWQTLPQLLRTWLSFSPQETGEPDPLTP